jgi:hypothetical protein
MAIRIIAAQLQVTIEIYVPSVPTACPKSPQEIAIPTINSTLAIKNKYQVHVRLTAFSLGKFVVCLVSIVT